MSNTSVNELIQDNTKDVNFGQRSQRGPKVLTTSATFLRQSRSREIRRRWPVVAEVDGFEPRDRLLQTFVEFNRRFPIEFFFGK